MQRLRTSHHNAGRTGFIPRSAYRVELDTKAIIKAANDFAHYEIRGRTMRNLPEYDDCKDYISDGIDITSFISAEAAKLAAIASDHTPPLFASNNSFPGISREDFENLSGVADQLICNMSILAHDNSRHGLQIPTIASTAWDIMIDTRRNIRLRYQQSDSIQTVEGRAPRMMPNWKANYIAYSQLLDYVLGIMSWWLMRCAQSEYWNKHIIAILAKWAVKLKIVAFDPQHSATTSLEQTRAIIDSMKAEAEFRETIIKVGGKERDITTFDTEADISNLYFEEKMELREHLSGIFISIMDALMIQERSGNDPDCFEVCSLVYWARNQGITNMIMGFRNGNISTSSVLHHINYAHSALELLDRNIEILNKQRPNTPPRTDPVPHVKLKRSQWLAAWQPVPTPAEIKIYNMDDIISVLVPMAFLHGKIARLANLLVDFTNYVADSRDIIQRVAPPDKDSFSEYVLSTQPWLEGYSPTGMMRSADPDVKQLAQSPIRIGFQATDAASAEGQRSILELRKGYNEEVRHMESWNCRAGSVVVHCEAYARFSQSIAALVVIGGLVIPFTVLDQIAGVDPFNITMFTWLLSGFILVVAKSLYVSDWPWYDFLAGRVECTRLSDLADVSGIDTQIVLLFFLQRDASSRFVTQGPYNGLFERQLNLDRKGGLKPKREDSSSVASLVQTGGFAIDKPVELWTLMAAGYIMLKVLSGEGEHLVCISGSKGLWDAASQGRAGNWLTCRGFNEEALEKAHGASKSGMVNKHEVFTLERMPFKWTKVLGVFVKNARFG